MDDNAPRANLQQLRTRPSLYLVEDIEYLEDFPKLIDEYWDWIFQEQLNGWMRAPESWPREPAGVMFLEWFDCKLSAMIRDMLRTRIKPLS